MPVTVAPFIDLTARTFDVLSQRGLEFFKRRVGSFRFNAVKATDIAPAIIDVISWFHEQNAHYYLRLQINSLLILADTREAMVPLALAQSYRMRPATSASVAVTASPQPPQGAPITLDAGSRVSSTDGIIFEVARTAVIPAGRTQWPDGTTDDIISLVEGQTRLETFVSDGTKFQRFELGLPGTIDGSVVVSILGETWQEVASLVFVEGDRRGQDTFQGTGLDSQAPTLSLNGAVIDPEDEDAMIVIVTPKGHTQADAQVWRQVAALTGAPREFVVTQNPDGVTVVHFGLAASGAAPGAGDTVDVRYLIVGKQKRYQLTYDQDDRATIRFGDDVTGIIPANGVSIQVQYRVGGGVRGNVPVGRISDSVLGGLPNGARTPVLLRNLEAGSGGNPPETVAHARFFAPRVAKSKERCVTKDDWTANAATFLDPLYGAPSHANAALKQNDPELNTVQIAVWGRDQNGNLSVAGSPLKLGMRNFLDTRRIICTHIEMIDGTVILMDIEADIVLETGKVRQTVFADIVAALTAFFQSTDVMPGIALSIGRVYKAIMDVDGVDRAEITRITGAIRQTLTARKPDGSVAAADGITNLFSGQFVLPEGTAIVGRSAIVTDGVQQVVDNGAGGFAGDLLSPAPAVGAAGNDAEYASGKFSVSFATPPPIGRTVTAEARIQAFFGKVEDLGASDGSVTSVNSASLYYPIVKRAPRGLWSGDPHLVIDGFVIPSPPGTTVRGTLPRGVNPGSLTIQDAVGGVNTTATDNGLGVIIVNALAVGTIDYTSGQLNFNFPGSVQKPVRARWLTKTMDFFLPDDLMPARPGRVFIWGGFGADGAETAAELIAYDDGQGNIAGNVLPGGTIEYATGHIIAAWNTDPPPGPGAGNTYYAVINSGDLPFDGKKRTFRFAIQGLGPSGISRFAASNLDRGEGRTRLQLSDLSIPGFSVVDAYDNQQGGITGRSIDRIGVNALTYLTGVGTLTLKTPPPALGAAPTVAPGVAIAAGGAVTLGAHGWAYSWLVNGVETPPSPATTATATAGNQTANLSGIANGPAGTTAKQIYRTLAGGAVLYRVGVISDNVTTVFADTIADGALGVPAAPFFRVTVTNVATVLYAGFVFYVTQPGGPGLVKGLFADNNGRFWGPPAAGPSNAFPTDQLDQLRGRYHAGLAGVAVPAGLEMFLTYDALSGVPPALDLVLEQDEVAAVGRISLTEKPPEVTL